MSEPQRKKINRRDFLKTAAGVALPTIAVVGLAGSARLSAASPARRSREPQDCGQTCIGSCRRVCADTCNQNCTGGCKNDCATGCNSNCKGGCTNNCATTCNNNCEGFCKGQNQY